MKKFLICIIISVFLLGVTACKKEGDKVDNQNVEMIATVLQNEGVLLVDVIKSEYAFGEYVLIVNENTSICNKNGKEIIKSDLQIGDKIIVTYSGQVMLSYPPQVVAYKINII